MEKGNISNIEAGKQGESVMKEGKTGVRTREKMEGGRSNEAKRMKRLNGEERKDKRKVVTWMQGKEYVRRGEKQEERESKGKEAKTQVRTGRRGERERRGEEKLV